MRKRDFTTGFGLICGFIAIVLGMLDGGNLGMFWSPSSIFITVLGSFFSVIISFPMDTIKKIPGALKIAFANASLPLGEVIERFVELSKKARREGLLSLEDELDNLDDDYLKSGIQMVVDGIEPETIREVMELEVDEMDRRHQGYISVFKLWANLAPAYGMIGTLIGLIQMLATLTDQASLGKGMAVALITSFYGSVLANLVFTPIANKLEVKNEEECKVREMFLEGVLAIQSGVNPRIVEEKLMTYLSPGERLKMLKDNISGDVVIENE